MLCMSSFKFKKYLINSNEENVETTIFQTRKGSMLVVSGQIWLKLENSSKLYCMFLLPESITKIGLKTTKKRWKHHFPHYKSMGVYFRHSRADYSILCGPILSKFKLLLDIMHVLNTYKFKMYLKILNEKQGQRRFF